MAIHSSGQAIALLRGGGLPTRSRSGFGLRSWMGRFTRTITSATWCGPRASGLRRSCLLETSCLETAPRSVRLIRATSAFWRRQCSDLAGPTAKRTATRAARRSDKRFRSRRRRYRSFMVERVRRTPPGLAPTWDSALRQCSRSALRRTRWRRETISGLWERLKRPPTWRIWPARERPGRTWDWRAWPRPGPTQTSRGNRPFQLRAGRFLGLPELLPRAQARRMRVRITYIRSMSRDLVPG